MKRVLVIILALAMVLPLCGCKSSDYDEALGLYNKGYYSSARTIFYELEDYKDSQAMAEKCTIELCISLLNSIDDSEYFFDSDVKTYDRAKGYYNSLSSANQALVTNSYIFAERELQYKQTKAEIKLNTEILNERRDFVKGLVGRTFQDNPEEENSCFVTWSQDISNMFIASTTIYYWYENKFGGKEEGSYRSYLRGIYNFETGEYEITHYSRNFIYF